MNWLVTIVIGGIVGWLGSLVMKTDMQMGLIANVIVGIIGSSLGFWLAGVLGLSATGPIMGWVVAVA
ncbi:MAG: GlsB/YeaQ/YmgE family stress response membrane protein, partial [Gemmatimonadota bacterium]